MKQQISRLGIIVLATLIVAAAGPTAAQAVILTRYASPTGVGGGSCATWGTACDLQFALSVAVSGQAVWVKEGLYKPTFIPGIRAYSFNIPPGVAVYGGFDGTETLLSARDPKIHVTILSGDIDNNDTNADGNNIAETYNDIQGGNSYHVVEISGTTTPVTGTTVLDGFTITGGQADGLNPDNVGGGLYCDGGGAGGNCSPTLSKLNFSGNRAEQGGALYNAGSFGGISSPTITDVTFQGNRATAMVGWGGAVYNAGFIGGGSSSPTFVNVTFKENSSMGSGGAIVDDGRGAGSSSPTFTNVTFHGNTAGAAGGAIYNVGSGTGGSSSPSFTNVTFSGNSATYAGAMYNIGSSSGSSFPTLKNVILWGDSDAGPTPEMFNDSAGPNISYSAIEGGCGNLAGSTCGPGNVSTNPNLGALRDNGGYTQTMALNSGSSAIDTGTNTGCTGTDQRAQVRPVDGDLNGSLTCDIGAYEYVGVAISGNAGAAGLSLGYSDWSPRTATTDGTGTYQFIVPSGWSGVVTPFAIGYGFSPASRSYTNVLTRQLSQDYTATAYPTSGMYDEQDAGWVYSGAWVSAPIPPAYELFHDTIHVGATAGGTASFGFYGDGFSLAYLRYPNWGTIALFLDGSPTPLATLNTNGAASVLTYNSPALMIGPHTLVIKHAGPSGSLIAFDSLSVRSRTAVGSGTTDDDDTNWSYTGTWTHFSTSGPFNGTLHLSMAPGSTATLFFNGTGFILTYLRYPGGGIMVVFLDGSWVPVGVIDANGTAALPVYISPTLSAGTHMLTIYFYGPAGTVVGTDVVTIAP